jgi:transposase
MVHEAIAESGERVGSVTRVARQLGIGPESLRNWVKRADVDNGKRPGVTTEQQRRITELERENRELRRANEILKAASAFFATYADVGISRVIPTLGLCRAAVLFELESVPLHRHNQRPPRNARSASEGA